MDLSLNRPASRIDAAREAVASTVTNIRFDLAAALLGCWMVAGSYVDGWAHVHHPDLETFFTPWHALLYSGFFVAWGVVLLATARNHARGLPWLRAAPRGYHLAVLGGFLFLAGGALDLAWHSLFGIEADTAALLSPTHLLLGTSAALIVGGPLRAAWAREKTDPGSWQSTGPAVLALTAALALLAFFTQYAHPFADPWAATNPRTREVRSELYLMNADGSGQTRLTVDPANEHVHPAWSPDGQKIAYAAGPNGAARQIYVANADGSNPTRLTEGSGASDFPAWAPDGKALVFARRGATGDAAGGESLYVIGSDGRGLTRLRHAPGRDIYPAWSPDGRTIAFTSVRDGIWQVSRVNADGTGLVRLTDGRAAEYFPIWSPDGTRLAYLRSVDGRNQIYVMDADGAHPTAVTPARQESRFPTWSPDGRRLAFASDLGGTWDVYIINADGTGQTNLSRNPGAENGNDLLAWSPDGRRILYSVRGHPGLTGFLAENLGLAAILLQTTLLMGALLLALRHGPLPVGAATLLVLGSSGAIALIHDLARLLPVALAAGLVADLLVWRLRPAPSRPLALRLVAFLVPVALFGLYFLAVLATGGVGWTIHLWLGAIALAGLTGLLLSLLVAPGPRGGAATAP